jgi:cell wall-associated NlpC family hydrolase
MAAARRQQSTEDRRCRSTVEGARQRRGCCTRGRCTRQGSDNYTCCGVGSAPAEVPNKLTSAARAVSAALTQQGTPYVYGGNAPGGFDCSGLVQWTYNKVGIALPRTAAAQATAGHRVSLSQLQPGDLLFFYQPVGHVVIYVGNGKIVEASQPGQPVRVRSLYLGGFIEARRIV